MKIYAQVKNFNNQTYIGINTLNDKGESYQLTVFKTENKSEEAAYLLGVKRVMAFVRNNKPLYTNARIKIYTPVASDFDFSKRIDERVTGDEYIQTALKPQQKISHNRKALSEEDKYQLMCAEIQINNEIFKDRMILLNKQKGLTK